MQAAAAGIERELADGDSHAARPLISQPQNALAIGHDDRLHRVEARLREDLVEP